MFEIWDLKFEIYARSRLGIGCRCATRRLRRKKVTRKARKSRKCFSEHELSIRQHAEYADGSRLRRKSHTESTEITETFFWTRITRIKRIIQIARILQQYSCKFGKFVFVKSRTSPKNPNYAKIVFIISIFSWLSMFSESWQIKPKSRIILNLKIENWNLCQVRRWVVTNTNRTN